MPAHFLHAISKLVGHLSPRTTLASYFHLTHWLAAELMRADRSFVPIEVVAQWLNVTKPMVLKALRERPHAAT